MWEILETIGRVVLVAMGLSIAGTILYLIFADWEN
jgi:hypothetical protein